MKKGMMSGCGALACSLALLFGCAPGGGDQAGGTAPYTLDFLTGGSKTEGPCLSDSGQIHGGWVRLGEDRRGVRRE